MTSVRARSCWMTRGKVNNLPTTPYNRLAYSLSRELIEIGVRTVVVAGRAVRDDAGEFFAETFYQALLNESMPFGEAIHKARQMTYENSRFSGCNTWGAYQAYGDPGFIIKASSPSHMGQPVAIEELLESIKRLSSDAFNQREDEISLKIKLKSLLKKAPKNWQNLPEVLYECGRFYGELLDFAEAIRYLERAVTNSGIKGQVPVQAIEQLANFEARQGEKNNDIDLIYRAIDRLRYLVKAAGGVDAAGHIEGAAINSERCGLLGSAYKRLAGMLATWSIETDDPEKPEGILQALALSAKWYGVGEGDPQQPGFSPYIAQNRLALQAVLGIVKLEDAELARHAGKIAHARYASSRNFWDLIMAGDGKLIAAIIDGNLMREPKAGDGSDAAQAIITIAPG